MCGNDNCNKMVQENHPANGKRILHTQEECKLLSNCSLGAEISDYENDNIVFACLFIHRM